MERRTFLSLTAATAAGSVCLPGAALAAHPYAGPSIIIVRFGGGTRRREVLDPAESYAPYFLHELVSRGTLFSRMEIAHMEGLNTSHGEGTLNILTGKYDVYADVDSRPLGARFEAQVPTLFEMARKRYALAPHECLLINGEDRLDEEFYTFSNHRDFGYDYRGRALSLYRYKVYKAARQLEEGKLEKKKLEKIRRELSQMKEADYRLRGRVDPDRSVESFWEKWRAHYGDSGFKNPRGDRLLTELTLWSMRELRPRVVIVNYNDCDYVHWGNKSHYTRGIQIMDEGLLRLVRAVEADPFYRDNTVFAVVPDCGRDNNPFVKIPYQHHFNSRSSREIFALFFGAGVAKGVTVDRVVQQVDVAPTLAAAMGMRAQHSEGDVLEEVFA